MVQELTVQEPAPTREAIMAFEEVLAQCPQLEVETRHYFSDGIYAREIVLEAGTVLTGKRHRTEHLNILSEGSIVVVTEDGRKRLDAPCTIVARPGTKRVGFALTRVTWTTVHANPSNTRDIAALETELISPERQLSNMEAIWHGSQ